MDELMARINDLGYKVSYTDAVAQQLAKDGYQPEFGARPLEREIRTKIEDLFAERMLSSELDKTKAYEICIRQGEITIIEKTPAKKAKATS